MAMWDPDAIVDPESLDYNLVQNSSVILFWSQSCLDKATKWLRDHGYHMVTVDAGKCSSSQGLLNDIATALQFPTNGRQNLSYDGFNDWMRDVAGGYSGWSSEVPAGAYQAEGVAGLVLVIKNIERLAAADPRRIHEILDIFAVQARSAMLEGNRLMCLVQSNDPRIEFDPVGATPVLWNSSEWSDSQRGL